MRETKKRKGFCLLYAQIHLVYTENYKELSRPIGPGAVYTKTRQNNYVTDLTGAIYVEKEIELS